jgi:prolyl-tRNA synthetase
MRWSRLFIPTLRENPADAETISQQLLVRAGFLRAVKTGVYGYLPLGQRAMGKIHRMARRELDALGAQEVNLSESDAAEIARGEIRGARLLPQIWFRIEAPLLRRRQFAGLDVYGLVRMAARFALPSQDSGAMRGALEVEDGFSRCWNRGDPVWCPGLRICGEPRTVGQAGSASHGRSRGDRKPRSSTPGQKIADIAVSRLTGNVADEEPGAGGRWQSGTRAGAWRSLAQ